MLKISEMAELANTTRRALIFYDQKNIFKPKYTASTGYRYYDYSQLYDLLFILGLRSLNLSLSEIKAIKSQSQTIQTSYLLNAQNKVTKKITEFVRIQQVLEKKLEKQASLDNEVLYKPVVRQRPPITFWCSRQAVNCTEAEVAQLFAEFYKQLDTLSIMDTTKAGCLTNLSIDRPHDYDGASFRIIKEVGSVKHKRMIPVLKKDAANYACVLVDNTTTGIHHGLELLQTFCHQQHLKTEDYLWQINSGEPLMENGFSKYIWLDFTILNSVDNTLISPN
ncbi:MerR family transcriptional regulator [Lactiplantibacillus xiangfangensis]|uniref:Transcriptional regulator n=1 Tax=Lactiplantibacillus xiangfangensis TaxID=942150 RepID=A0A0R2M9Y3_9LACO|nr:MerR family transcriptional regulator [Lactiplantibacillus xiangfangensis]KRO08509.1 transcriptional regulator [Lactiplantibacillus xiangfangensis]